MKLQEFYKEQEQSKWIDDLKIHRYIELPDVNGANKALDPKLHDINDEILRPDKKVLVSNESGNTQSSDSAQKVIESGEDKGTYRTEKVARVAIALQRLIVKRAVSFCFGNPINYNATPENDKQKTIIKALNRILYDVKCTSFNRKVGRSIFSYKECAELWFPVKKPKEHMKYGFKTPFKLRVALFSPQNGDTLYPYFDETGDMIAFSRSFSRVDGNKVSHDYFETYTDEEHWLWQSGENGFEVVKGYPKKIAIGKIPVIYGNQPYMETQDVNKLIDRLEKLLSNFADTNDYHASPKIFTTGTITGWSKKGEAGAVIEGEEGADMKYVSWAQAPESVKLEIETLLKLIYTITQTPDISFDSVKGLGAISGLALKLLFMDAHLKVQDKREIFDDYLQRRVNVILSYIATFDQSLQEECDMIEIEPEIVPYMLTSEMDELNYWMTANGNKPVVSQEESIEGAGISKNPELTMKKIEAAADKENSFLLGEPVIEPGKKNTDDDDDDEE